MVYSKGRILLQSAEERGGKKPPPRSLPLPLSLWSVSQAGKGAGEARGRRGAPPPRRRVPSGRVKTNDSEDSRKERETNGAGAVLPQAGRCAWSSGAGRTSLSSSPWIQKASGVLAQSGLPSDSGRDKRQTASDAGGREAAGIWHTERVRCSGKGDVGSGRMASMAQRLVGHAKRKHTVMEGGYW